MSNSYEADHPVRPEIQEFIDATIIWAQAGDVRPSVTDFGVSEDVQSGIFELVRTARIASIQRAFNAAIYERRELLSDDILLEQLRILSLTGERQRIDSTLSMAEQRTAQLIADEQRLAQLGTKISGIGSVAINEPQESTPQPVRLGQTKWQIPSESVNIFSPRKREQLADAIYTDAVSRLTPKDKKEHESLRRMANNIARGRVNPQILRINEYDGDITFEGTGAVRVLKGDWGRQIGEKSISDITSWFYAISAEQKQTES